jgi:ribonucleotide monophosphatase NagD (HAD superfamily)
MGGRTLIAGKPFAPIYEAALAAAAGILGRPVAPGDALAIGDGVLTDVKGAANAGIDVLYISGGIHAGEYGGAAGPDAALLGDFLAGHGFRPVAYMPGLR